MTPQSRPSMPVMSAASRPWVRWPRPKAMLNSARPRRAPPRSLSNRCRMNAALHFLAHAAGEHDDHREDPHAPRRGQHRLQRVLRHVVHPRRERLHDAAQADHQPEHDRQVGDAAPHLAPDAAQRRAARARHPRRAAAGRARPAATMASVSSSETATTKRKGRASEGVTRTPRAISRPPISNCVGKPEHNSTSRIDRARDTRGMSGAGASNG